MTGLRPCQKSSKSKTDQNTRQLIDQVQNANSCEKFKQVLAFTMYISASFGSIHGPIDGDFRRQGGCTVISVTLKYLGVFRRDNVTVKHHFETVRNSKCSQEGVSRQRTL